MIRIVKPLHYICDRNTIIVTLLNGTSWWILCEGKCLSYLIGGDGQYPVYVIHEFVEHWPVFRLVGPTVPH